MTVLIVDQMADWAEDAQEALESSGYRVLHATSMRRAAKLAEHCQPSLLLVGASVAFEDDGVWLKKLARCLPGHVYVLSERESVATAIRAFKHRAEYALKPLSQTEMAELVESILAPVNNPSPKLVASFADSQLGVTGAS